MKALIRARVCKCETDTMDTFNHTYPVFYQFKAEMKQVSIPSQPSCPRMGGMMLSLQITFHFSGASPLHSYGKKVVSHRIPFVLLLNVAFSIFCLPLQQHKSPEGISVQFYFDYLRVWMDVNKVISINHGTGPKGNQGLPIPL